MINKHEIEALRALIPSEGRKPLPPEELFKTCQRLAEFIKSDLDGALEKVSALKGQFPDEPRLNLLEYRLKEARSAYAAITLRMEAMK